MLFQYEIWIEGNATFAPPELLDWRKLMSLDHKQMAHSAYYEKLDKTDVIFRTEKEFTKEDLQAKLGVLQIIDFKKETKE